MEKIKIVLVDDHRMFRDGVKSVLSDEANIELIGELGNGKDLYELLKSKKPDLIITDISMPDISGIEITRFVAENYPEIKVLVLSMHSNEEFITKALSAGANGYLPKDTSMKELLEAINTISRGDNYFNKEISDTILKSIINKSKSSIESARSESLTKREKEIVNHVVDGFTNKEIAEKLFISIRTVDSHKNNIMQKLKLKSSVELVKYAIKNKLTSLD
ncbi:MAG TPA: DNA-binding response regulator [Bacteroidales bacterium]|jgi:DNA-binding NarL/FixJ family response regulator|nr:DNA-binding response regulator [Bacteroidales bacterium]